LKVFSVERMRGYFQEMWSLFIKKIKNRTPKTALFINLQAEHFSDVQKKKICLPRQYSQTHNLRKNISDRALPEVLDFRTV
jgi:hypothetical protein